MRYSLLGSTVGRRIRLISLICLAFAAGILPVHAYVLDAIQILDRAVKAIGNTGAAVINQSLVLHAAAGDGDAPRVGETLSYIFPGRFRSEIRSETAHKIHVWSEGDQVTIINDQIPADGEAWFDRYKDLMIFNTVPPLETHLQKAGLDTSVSSIGRFEGRLAFIIGAQYPDESVPQIWVDHKTFVPFRWIVYGRSPTLPREMHEIRYQGWHRAGGIWYPMRIAFFVNDALYREIQIDRIRPQKALPEDLFDVGHIRSSYERRMPEGGETGMGGAEEVQRTIEDFKRIYEP